MVCFSPSLNASPTDSNPRSTMSRNPLRRSQVLASSNNCSSTTCPRPRANVPVNKRFEDDPSGDWTESTCGGDGTIVGKREGNESSFACGEMVDAFFALAAFGSMNGSTLLSALADK
jgi:hypothetical protein